MDERYERPVASAAVPTTPRHRRRGAVVRVGRPGSLSAGGGTHSATTYWLTLAEARALHAELGQAIRRALYKPSLETFAPPADAAGGPAAGGGHHDLGGES